MNRDGGGRTPVSVTPPVPGSLYDRTFSPSGTSIAAGQWSNSSIERFGRLIRIDLTTGATTTLVTVDYVLGPVGPDWRAP